MPRKRGCRGICEWGKSYSLDHVIGGGTLLSSFHSQDAEDGCGVDELLLVLLDADVVGAVVDVDVAVLRPQPHRRLLRLLLQVAVVRGAAAARRWGRRRRGNLLG